MEAAVRHEQPIGHQQVQVRVPAAIITKCLDGRYRTELTDIRVEGRIEETKQAAVGALAQSGEQFAIVAKINTQDFRQGKDVLAMRQG